VERPQWSALDSMIADLGRAVDGMGDMQRSVARVTGTAWSEDRFVKAVVGPRGQLVDLEIDPRVFRKPDSKELASTILATVRAAVDQANARSQELLDALVPKDLRDIRLGGVDLREFSRTHDADLRPDKE
jgi:DNA-binding protein YbaB